MIMPKAIERQCKVWQRARIYSPDRTLMAEVWVQCGPPVYRFVRSHASRCDGAESCNLGPALGYKTNVECPEDGNRACWVIATDVELLPRGANRVKYLKCNEVKYSRIPLSMQKVRTADLMEAAE